MEKFYSVKEFSLAIDKSEQFVRNGIKSGKFEAQLVGNRYVLPRSEVLRFRENPFIIRRREMPWLGQNSPA